MAGNSRMLFVNLSVRDLPRSMQFFSKLGFEFNKQFTDETAACMVVSEQAFVMLLTESKFSQFTKNAICDTSKASEGLFALSCTSREEVDQIVEKAVAAGGRHAMTKMDMGFMYGWSFYDVDGHHWEVMWMDPAAIQPQ
ncbi:VOC family protein [Sandaracinus amylolyticus]|uniref:Glyoxalase family protein n=1 Tax=Sandaracinus amylolyticus TaxID=927083 RepID=A0A0F6W370_9BACT|nr:VOC family protein [Sandaracinus amylolyticus]AKF06108.1 Glyoxalase family protein [Sandaracinus amylolyticus]